MPAGTTVDELVALHRALTKVSPPPPPAVAVDGRGGGAAAAAPPALVFVGGGRRVVLADGWRPVAYYVGDEGGGRAAGTVFWGS